MPAGPDDPEAANRIRIARAVAMVGPYSRRAADRLVQAGQVAVNGALVDDPATLVDPAKDRLAVQGRALARPSAREYYALNKPLGIVSTVRDPHATRTVLDLVPSASRLYPVGRLDKDSEGLLLLTSDGAFANRITHPRYEVEKEYRALVTQPPSVEMVEQLRVGLVLNGRRVVPDRVNVDRKAEGWWIDVTLHEGQKREVRRLLGAVGMQVHKLVRVRIGPVRLGRLRPGEYRPLESSEVEALLDGKRPKQSPTGKQPR